MHPCVVGDAAVPERLRNGEICVMKLDIFADECDRAFAGGLDIAFYHRTPCGEVGLALLKVQHVEHYPAKPPLLQHEGNLVEGTGVEIFDNIFFGNIAEQAYLGADTPVDGVVAAADDDVGLNADALKLLDRMLGGLGLKLSRCGQIGNKRHMDEAALVHAELRLELTNGFKEGLGFDIADGAAYLDYHNIGLKLLDRLADAELYFVRDMGNDLDGAALIAAPALAVEHGGIDLTRGGVVEPGEILVDEAFIVADIKVGLGAVVGNEHLAVLIGVHGAGVDVEIGVKLHDGYAVSSGLEKPAQRGGGDTLSE